MPVITHPAFSLPSDYSPAKHKQIVFVEDDVADLASVLASLDGYEVHLLDAASDGLQQIATLMAGRSGIEALHLLSHGSSAAIHLGSLTLDRDSLGAERELLAAIGSSLAPQADILLYGCNVAAGASGQALIDALAQASNADVAASSNLTGSAALGGDWQLEAHSGPIEARALSVAAMAGVLNLSNLTINFELMEQFGNFGGGGLNASNDVIYNVENSAYTLVIDGEQSGVRSYAQSYIFADPHELGETKVSFSFQGEALFSPGSVVISNGANTTDQTLAFRAWDANNGLAGEILVSTGSQGNMSELITVDLSGFDSIKRLEVIPVSNSNQGMLYGITFDNLLLREVNSGIARVVSVSAPVSSASYKVGDQITIEVQFSDIVTVTDSASLNLAVGATPRAAVYSSGSDTNTLSFIYTVQAGDHASDLDYSSSNALLTDGSINSHGYDASLLLPAPASADSLAGHASLVVDGIAPSLTISSDYSSLNGAQSATITFSFSEDPGSSFQWDGSSGDVLVSGGSLSALSGTGLTRTAVFTPSPHTDTTSASISVGAASYSDAAGNDGAAAATPSLTIDTLAQPATISAVTGASDSGSSASDGISNVLTPVLAGTGEALASVQIYDGDNSLLGQTSISASGNWQLTLATLGEGSHSLYAVVTDAAGNRSQNSVSYTYQLDSTAPTQPTLSSNSIGLTGASAGATLATLSASDSGAGIAAYALVSGNGINDLNNADFSISGNLLSAAHTLAAGTYQIYLRATDLAGNASYRALSYTVGDVPAVSSIVRSDAAAALVDASSSSIRYTVTFNQSVSGVDLSDFTLVGSGTASGSLDSISGSAASYTVTVSALSGDGELRLDLNASGTGIQNAATLSAQTGYSSGQGYTLDHTRPPAPDAPTLDAASDDGRSHSDGITSIQNPILHGSAEAYASIRLYDSDGVTLLGSTTADASGSWNITSSVLSEGNHYLSVRQLDVAGNLSPASAPRHLKIVAEAAPEVPMVDGTPVSTSITTMPDNRLLYTTTIPTVTPARIDSNGLAGVADVPLLGNSAGTTLLAQICAGYGLSAVGSINPSQEAAASSLQQAISTTAAPLPTALQQQLVSAASSHLQQLSQAELWQVLSITPQLSGPAPATPLSLIGTSAAGLRTALVIDASQSGAGSNLTLGAIDLAILIGNAQLHASVAGQLLLGDSANQQFILDGHGNASVLAGAGNDLLQWLSSATPATGSGASGQLVLHGGSGFDRMQFDGSRDQYSLRQEAGHCWVSPVNLPEQLIELVNFEQISFSDSKLNLPVSRIQASVASLYAAVLGRQADLGGFDFWTSQAEQNISLGSVALNMISSSEAQQQPFNHDAAHDVELLYQNLLHRHSDAAGAAFWVQAMQHGVTLEQVADGFLLSNEWQAHLIAASQWDFTM